MTIKRRGEFHPKPQADLELPEPRIWISWWWINAGCFVVGVALGALAF